MEGERKFKLFVGNLPWTINDKQLQLEAEKFGKVVNCTVVYDRMTGQSKGIGFLDFADKEGYENALENLPTITIDGRQPRVSASEKKEEPKNENQHKLFLGNLSWTIKEETLREAGEKYGNLVECTVIYDKLTGQSKGFGFLTYADAASYEKAYAGLQGQEIDGRNIRVSRHEQHEAGASLRRGGFDPYQPDDPRYTPGDGESGGKPPLNKIYIGNIPFEMTEEDLRKHFDKFGSIEYASIGKDKTTGKPRGYGFVTYFKRRDMEDAILVMDGREIEGRPVKVVEANKGETGGGPFPAHPGDRPRRGADIYEERRGRLEDPRDPYSRAPPPPPYDYDYQSRPGYGGPRQPYYDDFQPEFRGGYYDDPYQAGPPSGPRSRYDGASVQGRTGYYNDWTRQHRLPPKGALQAKQPYQTVPTAAAGVHQRQPWQQQQQQPQGSGRGINRNQGFRQGGTMGYGGSTANRAGFGAGGGFQQQRMERRDRPY